MEKVLEYMDTCYGCGACCNACSLEAVSMQPDSEGFLYPVIQADRCVDCDICRQVCPVLHTEFTHEEQAECYAVIGPDELRLKSSSGGAFTALAEYALQNGGLVCGAAMTDDFTAVEHIIVDGEDGLDKLRKSKYVQSDTKNVYQETEMALQGGRFVLFSGTPCQVAGLKCYLGREYEQLITVDLLCKGVPSPKAWRLFLQETAQGRKVVHVDFRDKTLGPTSALAIDFADGVQYLKRGSDSCWIKAYDADLMSRKSCGSCPFPYFDRVGDITIGDFWGIDRLDAAFGDSKGVNILIINSEKGKKYLYTSDMLERWKTKSFSYPESRRCQAVLYKNFKPHPGREVFYDSINAGQTFLQALNNALNKRYDTAVLGFWFTNNYGAAMTTFALSSFLTEEGYRPILIDIPENMWKGNQSVRDVMMPGRRFLSKHFAISKQCTSKMDLKSLNDLCDTFIVGADQTWSWHSGQFAQEGAFYFLDFAEEGKRKIAYAAGFDKNKFDSSQLDKKAVRYLLNRFDAVSVREKDGVDICLEKFGVKVDWMLDPVFLCDKNFYLQVASQSRLYRENSGKRIKKFIAAYVLQPTEEKQKIIQYVSQQLGYEAIIISDLDSNYVNRPGCIPWRLRHLKQMEMEDWLYYLSEAEFVITDSFHGLCFSLIFERNFICMKPRDNGRRLVGLSDLFHLGNRVGVGLEQIKSDHSLLEQMDYTAVQKILQREKSRCRTWLKDALQKPIESRTDFSTYDMLGVQMDLAVGSLREDFKEYRKEDNQMANGNVYFDSGDGFSEKNKKAFSFDAEKNRIELSIPVPAGTKKLRFDPVEGVYCTVSDVTVSSDGFEFSVTEHNGVAIENQVLFLTEDPQFLIEIPESGINKVCISSVVSLFSGGGALKILQLAASLERKNSELQQQADGQKISATQWQCRAEEDERSVRELRELSEEAEKRADEAERRAEEAEKCAEDREKCLKEQTVRAEEAERELESLYSSTAYKVGRVLTFTRKRPKK